MRSRYCTVYMHSKGKSEIFYVDLFIMEYSKHYLSIIWIFTKEIIYQMWNYILGEAYSNNPKTRNLCHL